MVLSDEYSSYVAKAIKEIESPDEFSTGFAALRALLLEDAEDPEDLAQSLHRYQILKRIGIDLKRFEEFVTDEDLEASIERICNVLKKDLPYALWPYLASPEVLRRIFHTMGKGL